ncbi:MAG: hypothetical protein ACXABI_09735 [Candidatus Hodarchaeales archaeon]|jgi:hypothetical protein
MRNRKYWVFNRRKYGYIIVGLLFFVSNYISFSTSIEGMIQDSNNFTLDSKEFYNNYNLEPVKNLIDYKYQDITYIGHGPISIDGNQDLINQAATEGWAGDGSKTHPFMINELETTSYTWDTRDSPEDSSNLIKVVATCSIGVSIEVVINNTIIIDNRGPPPNFTFLMVLFALIAIIPELYLGRKFSTFVNKQKVREGV